MFDAGPSGRLALDDLRDFSKSARPGAGAFAARAAMAACGIAALLLIAVAATWWGQAARIGRLEADLARRDDQWKGQVARLETAILARDRVALAKAPMPPAPAPRISAPTPAPTTRDKAPELLLARLEDGLAKLDRRLAESEGTQPTPTDATSDQLRQDFEGLKRDVEARDKDLRQGLREMRSALQGVVQYMRQLSVQQGMLQNSLQMPYQFPMPVYPGVVAPGVGTAAGAGNNTVQGGTVPNPVQGQPLPGTGQLHPGGQPSGVQHPGHPAAHGHSK
jgi:hypothetical protein